jgi:hypothetical protein
MLILWSKHIRKTITKLRHIRKPKVSHPLATAYSKSFQEMLELQGTPAMTYVFMIIRFETHRMIRICIIRSYVCINQLLEIHIELCSLL